MAVADADGGGVDASGNAIDAGCDCASCWGDAACDAACGIGAGAVPVAGTSSFLCVVAAIVAGVSDNADPRGCGTNVSRTVKSG